MNSSQLYPTSLQKLTIQHSFDFNWSTIPVHLTAFDVTNTTFQLLSAPPHELPYIEFFSIRSSQLTTQTLQLSQLPNCKTLKLQSNQLNRIPLAIYQFKELENLYFDYNPLQIVVSMDQMKFLNGLTILRLQGLPALPCPVGTYDAEVHIVPFCIINAVETPDVKPLEPKVPTVMWAFIVFGLILPVAFIVFKVRKQWKKQW